jgi:uncharacterized protein
MRRIPRNAAVPLAALLLAVHPAAAQSYPDEPGDGIADLAFVLDPADADSIRSTLYRMREQAGVEVRVLTVQRIAGFGTRDATPEAFATGVYNAWKLGYGQRQDGVLVLLSVDDRFTRIELGDGVPADQDARMRAIVDGVMMPRFRSGDMSGGLRDGVTSIARSFGAAPPMAEAPAEPYASAPAEGLYEPYSPPLPARRAPAADPYEAPKTNVLPLVALLAAVAGGLGVVALVRARPRKCAHCKVEMQRIGEQADDVYLDSGRRLEEVLGSVDYAVWKCARCGEHEIRRSARWFSGMHDCPRCSYRTVRVHRETLEYPTYDSDGRQRVEKDCAHCHWHDEDIVYLPRKERPSESSSFSSSGSSSSGTSSHSSGTSSHSSGSSGGHSSGRGSSGSW